jgi:sulfur-carrier protein
VTAVIRLFAAAREAAGADRYVTEAATVAAALDEARERYGPAFSALLSQCRIWVNGEPATEATSLADGDELAVLPPVSGG